MGSHLHLPAAERAQVAATLGAGAVGPSRSNPGEVFLALDAGTQTLQNGCRLRLGPS